MIIRQSEPANLEMPFGELDGFFTPNDKFYVRSHFATPEIDPATWRLRIEGAVERPLELSYDELRARPMRTVAVTMECAGEQPNLSPAESERRAMGNGRGRKRRVDRRVVRRSFARDRLFGRGVRSDPGGSGPRINRRAAAPRGQRALRAQPVVRQSAP